MKDPSLCHRSRTASCLVYAIRHDQTSLEQCGAGETDTGHECAKEQLDDKSGYGSQNHRERGVGIVQIERLAGRDEAGGDGPDPDNDGKYPSQYRDEAEYSQHTRRPGETDGALHFAKIGRSLEQASADDEDEECPEEVDQHARDRAIDECANSRAKPPVEQ